MEYVPSQSEGSDDHSGRSLQLAVSFRNRLNPAGRAFPAPEGVVARIGSGRSPPDVGRASGRSHRSGGPHAESMSGNQDVALVEMTPTKGMRDNVPGSTYGGTPWAPVRCVVDPVGLTDGERSEKPPRGQSQRYPSGDLEIPPALIVNGDPESGRTGVPYTPLRTPPCTRTPVRTPKPQ
jgi:hypothetical protein